MYCLISLNTQEKRKQLELTLSLSCLRLASKKNGNCQILLNFYSLKWSFRI
jgi:hypothetical protein